MSLPPTAKLRQGNVFTPVCQSVHGGGLSVSAFTTGGSLSGGLCLARGSLSRGLCPGGSLSRGVSVQGGLCPGGLCLGVFVWEGL